MRHLAEALNKDKPDDVVVFTREEAEILKGWAQFMMAWRTLGKWWPSARSVILSLATVLGLLAGAKAGFLEWMGISGGLK